MITFIFYLLGSCLVSVALAIQGNLGRDLRHNETIRNQFVGFDCKSYPHMCKPPFNCQDAQIWDLTPQAKNGHANLQSWCNFVDAQTFADNVLKKCIVDQDLKGSAEELFDKRVGLHSDEIDASYCFIEGHCTNTAVTDNTTVQDAEEMCTDRFGKTGWTGPYYLIDPLIASVASGLDFYGSLGSTLPVSPFEGIHEQKISKLAVKLACSRGTYHCDVQYCKHTYCTNSYYIRRYGHLIPKTAGHLIIDP